MYWEYYKDKDSIINPMNYSNGINNMFLRGFTGSELYVPQKYSTYKDEILRHIPIRYYEDIATKLNEIYKTEKVKHTRCWLENQLYHYDVEFMTPITRDHILSVILYCDLDGYQAEFSSTFRKLRYTESFESVKKRNREYWFQSKYLRETVQLFGSCEYGIEDEDKITLMDTEKGPYYTGLNRVMIIPQFTIYLNAPTSTTMDIDVSANFAARDGMIIEFSRTGFTSAKWLANFDCTWLSRYPEENERLFMFGFTQIRVQSVRIIDTTKRFDFDKFFKLDSLLSGLMHGSGSLSLADCKKADELLAETTESLTQDPYMVNLFRAWYRQKSYIEIHLWNTGLLEKMMLDTANYCNDKPIQWKIMQLEDEANRTPFTIKTCLDEEKDTETEQKWDPIKSVLQFLQGNITMISIQDFNALTFKRKINLISPDIFEIFPNCKSFHISTNTPGFDVDYSYPFNMYQFLTIITKSSSWEKFEISHTIEEAKRGSWISKTWEALSGSLINTYGSKQLAIQFRSDQAQNYAQEMHIITKFVITRKGDDAEFEGMSKQKQIKAKNTSSSEAERIVDIAGLVEHVKILNMDPDESTMYEESRLIRNCNIDDDFIVSDIDQEMIILIKFRNIVSLKSIKVYANNIHEVEDVSVPKKVSIYKLKDLDVDFEDLKSRMKADKSLICSEKKLSTKGVTFKLQNESKLTVKFKTAQCIAIFIETNQNDTEKTIINKVLLKGYDASVDDEGNELTQQYIDWEEKWKIWKIPKCPFQR